MRVSVGISNHHVHLTEEDLNLLFGYPLTVRNNLKQPGQFASNQIVDVIGPKGEIKGLRVLGPTRSYTQVEVSKTDCYKLGISAPVRDSGDLENASVLTIVGPKGSVSRACGIIATRHIHLDSVMRKEKGLENVLEVSVKIPGIKGGIINHVHLKESKEAYFEMHLDTDDANAFLLKNDDEVEILVD